jgi:hypothetical protein
MDIGRRDFIESAAGYVSASALLTSGCTSLASQSQKPVNKVPQIVDGFWDFDQDGEISEEDLQIRKGLSEEEEHILDPFLDSVQEYEQKAAGVDDYPNAETLRVTVTHNEEVDRESVQSVAENYLEPLISVMDLHGSIDVESPINFVSEMDNQKDALDLHDEAIEFSENSLEDNRDIHIHVSNHSGKYEKDNDNSGIYVGYGENGRSTQPFSNVNTAVIYQGEYDSMQKSLNNYEGESPSLFYEDIYDNLFQLTLAHELNHTLGYTHSDADVLKPEFLEEIGYKNAIISDGSAFTYTIDALENVQNNKTSEKPLIKDLEEQLEEIDTEISNIVYSPIPLADHKKPVNPPS